MRSWVGPGVNEATIQQSAVPYLCSVMALVILTLWAPQGHFTLRYGRFVLQPRWLHKFFSSIFGWHFRYHTLLYFLCCFLATVQVFLIINRKGKCLNKFLAYLWLSYMAIYKIW